MIADAPIEKLWRNLDMNQAWHFTPLDQLALFSFDIYGHIVIPFFAIFYQSPI